MPVRGNWGEGSLHKNVVTCVSLNTTVKRPPWLSPKPSYWLYQPNDIPKISQGIRVELDPEVQGEGHRWHVTFGPFPPSLWWHLVEFGVCIQEEMFPLCSHKFVTWMMSHKSWKLWYNLPAAIVANHRYPSQWQYLWFATNAAGCHLLNKTR